MSAKGESNGFGFVQFTTDDAAKAAIEETDGKLLEGQLLSVCLMVL